MYRHRCSEKDRSDDQAFQSEFSGSCACTSGLSGQRMYPGLRRDRRVTGYINHWNPKVDLKTNICRQILSRNGYMYNKAENIIGASLRELSVYDTILACIAGGCDKLNDLYLKTGFSACKDQRLYEKSCRFRHYRKGSIV